MSGLFSKFRINALFFWSVIIIFIFCISAFSAFALTWKPTGLINRNLDTPYGKIKADPLDPKVIWVATCHLFYPNPIQEIPRANGLFKTTNKGNAWIQMNDENLTPEINIFDIAIDPQNTNIVYLATNQHGFFKTTDGGFSWTPINDGIEYKGKFFPEESWCATAIAVDPHDTSIIYGCISNVNKIDMTSGTGDHPGFYKSTNGGLSWQEKNQGLPVRYDPITPQDLVSHTSCAISIAFHPQESAWVIVGLGDAELNANWFLNRSARTKGRIFYNTNRGDAEWKEASQGLPNIIGAVNNPGSFARASLSAIFFCGNFGKGGFIVNHFGATSEIFDYPFTTNTVTKCKGMYKWSANSWKATNTGIPVTNDPDNINSINAISPVISPVNPKTIFVGVFDADAGNPGSNKSQVYTSNNGGTNWAKDVYQGLEVSLHGYTEASPFFLEVNADQSLVFTTVRWDFNPNDPWSAGTQDDGVYVLAP